MSRSPPHSPLFLPLSSFQLSPPSSPLTSKPKTPSTKQIKPDIRLYPRIRDQRPPFGLEQTKVQRTIKLKRPPDLNLKRRSLILPLQLTPPSTPTSPVGHQEFGLDSSRGAKRGLPDLPSDPALPRKRRRHKSDGVIRTRPTNYKQYTKDDMASALNSIELGLMSVHGASLTYNIPERTVWRKVQEPRAGTKSTYAWMTARGTGAAWRILPRRTIFCLLVSLRHRTT